MLNLEMHSTSQKALIIAKFEKVHPKMKLKNDFFADFFRFIALPLLPSETEERSSYA